MGEKATKKADIINEQKQQKLPAILLYNFEPCDSNLSMVSSLIHQGHPVIAVCPSVHSQSASAARELGCIVIGSERGESIPEGFESILSTQYQNWVEGNALRAGLTYFHQEMGGLPGVVCTDAKTGYAAEDIIAVSSALLDHPNRFIIASRRCDAGLGALKKFQRSFAGLAFSTVHSRKVKDPWADLRALPTASIPALLDLQGRGKKYEFNMVLNLQHKGIKAFSVPVSAIDSCAEGMKGRAWDTSRILFLPLKFVMSSLLAMGTDYCIRFLTYGIIMPGNETVAVYVGRFSGALINYIVNRNVVFRHKNESAKQEAATLVKFALLATFNALVALLLIQFFMDSLGISFYIASPMADALLYAPNYLIQRDIVFRRRKPKAA